MSVPDRVNPGELITADFINDILRRLKIVEDKLADPGTTSGVVRITTLMPAGTIIEPIRVGQPLQIMGENFGYFAGQASVVFQRPGLGDVVIQSNQMLNGSSDTRLLVSVPPLAGLSQAGETMTLRVRNGTNEDHRSIFVKPVVIVLQGDLFLDWRTDVAPPNPNPNPLQVSQAASFNYKLRTATNLPATFDLSATITNATVAVPAGLESSIEFRDESGNLIPGKQLEMGTSDTRNIVVRIPQIPPSFAAQSFRLNINAAAGGLSGGDARTFTVGVAVTPPDPDIHIEQTGTAAFDVATGADEFNTANARLDGTTIKLKSGKQMVVMFNVTQLASLGTYDITIAHKAGTSGWGPALVSTPTPITVANEADKIKPRFLQFTVAAGASSVNGTVLFKVKRQGATSDFSKEYGVEKLP